MEDPIFPVFPGPGSADQKPPNTGPAGIKFKETGPAVSKAHSHSGWHALSVPLPLLFRGLLDSLGWTLLIFLGLFIAIPLRLPLFPDDYSLVVEDREGRILRVFLNEREQWHFPPTAEQEGQEGQGGQGRQEGQGEQGDQGENEETLPEKLVGAVCTYEDRSFFCHLGLDLKALGRAAVQNLIEGRRVSGASTITMQVARLMRAKPRTLPNKLLEMLQAMKIEALFDKEEILMAYLDHAPYGGNTVGIKAAAHRYFGKGPATLTWAEAALLAVLPNAPGLISPDMGRDELLAKRNSLLAGLHERGLLEKETYRISLGEPLPVQSIPFSFLAPHLTERIKTITESGYRPAGAASLPAGAASSPAGLFPATSTAVVPGPRAFSAGRLISTARASAVRTTLDLDLQQAVEELAAIHSHSMSGLGVQNLAILVAETGSGRIRVYVGSQDYHDEPHNGQVDGVMAFRSSGSLLKPFLYGLAMDEGFFLPCTQIRDIPTQFGSFSPKNPDLKYDGLVTVREALIRSLNVPAVRVLKSYGIERFYAFLKAAGVSSLFRSPHDYGLPLILGGAEANLYELAMLYRGLANGGRFSSLTLFEPTGPVDYTGSGSSTGSPAADQDRVLDRAPRLISPGACYLVLDMLRELRRPGVEYYWESYLGGVPLAWKTGTSFGQKDAWAIGVNPEWLIAVWMGNFTGRGNANLRSSTSAAPLLFDILNILPRDEKSGWFEPPAGELGLAKLCLKTGFRAGPHCEETVFAAVPIHAPPLPQCPYHRSIYVTNDGAYRVDSRCWEPGNYRHVVKLIYPPDVTQFIRESGRMLETVPPFMPGYSAGSGGGGGDGSGHGSGGAGGGALWRGGNGMGSESLDLPLKILYPEEGAKLWIPRDLDGSYEKITIRAAHSEKSGTLYWYVDGFYQGLTRERHAKSLLLSGGRHRIEVIDSRGNRVGRSFRVDIK